MVLIMEKYSIEWILSRDDKFRYMLLDRMRQDCDYYLGNGDRNAEQLWAVGSVDRQIAYMKAILNSFKDKPEWLTMEQIKRYERLMKPNVKEASRSREYSAWYGKVVERVVFFIDGHFLHHQYEGDIPEYDKDRYDRDMRMKINRYQQTGGQWIIAEPSASENQFTWRTKRGPVEFIKEVRKCGQTFRDITMMTYCDNGKCWLFSGNLNEVSNGFGFFIYTKELADEVRSMIPEVEYSDEDRIIM